MSLAIGPLVTRQLKPDPFPQLVPGSGLLGSPETADPLHFSPEELRELQRRFGVHGPQPKLAQLFTEGIDQLQPLRNHTLQRLEELRPVILQESARQRVNPVFVTAVLFDEMRHAKPGEDIPMAAQSGLFSTHGPGQLAVTELMHQGLLARDASEEELAAARAKLLDPAINVQVLVRKFARLTRELRLPVGRTLQASHSRRDAKGLATLAYLHNGKLDYPRRILRSMQDPELHALLFSERKTALPPLI
ncbi:MAG: helicase DnaB [Cyanobacteriota bacterium]